MPKGKGTVGSKTGSKAARGRRGGLKDLPRMPVDILIEALSYLCPMDILNLARTSKDFRKFLMIRSSEFIWKRARHNIDGFPPCPDDLSEPAYANLAFDTHCHVCSSPGARNIMWILRTRYCPSCKKQNLVPRSQFWERLAESTQMDIDDVWEFTPVVLIDMYDLCHLPTAERLFHNAATPEDVRRNAELLKAEFDAREAHALLCEQWQTAVKTERKEELSVIRQNRLTDITARLTALGWGPELETLKEIESSILSDHPYVKQAKELTDRSWNHILPSLLTVMEKAKTHRTMMSRRTVLVDRLQMFNEFYAEWRHAQGLATIVPIAMNLATNDKLRDLIVETPDDDEFTKAKFDVLRELLPAWVDEWKNSRAEELFERFCLSEDLEAHQYVNLASTVWECFCCDGPVLSYPELLEHRCMNQKRDIDKEFGHSWESLIKMANNATLWDTFCFHHPRWGTQPGRILKACGMDREHTTIEEMDELDARLGCVLCDSMHGARDSPVHAHTVFTWRAAIRHQSEHAHVDATGRRMQLEWTRIPEHLVRRVKAIEDGAINWYTKHYEHPEESKTARAYCCAYCPKGKMDQKAALEHVQTAHPRVGPDNPSPNYYLDRSFGPIEGSPVMLILAPQSIQELTEYAESGDLTAEQAWDWVDDGRAGFL